jgi:hypothetical protein
LTLATREARGEVLAVYAGRARIGYLCPSSTRLPDEKLSAEPSWLWEISLVSEQARGHPRGREPTREAALARCEEVFALWCRAAGLCSREALEPFASYAVQMRDSWTHRDDCVFYGVKRPGAVQITYGDFRRAAREIGPC